MHRLTAILKSLLRGLPSSLDHLSIFQLVEDAITAEDYEVIILLHFEAFYVWRCDHDLRVAAVLGALGLDITKRSADREATREDAMRTEQDLIAHNPGL